MVQRKRLPLLIGAAVLALALLACGESTSSTASPSATPSIAYQLATLDAGASPDSATVAKYQKLLDSLHSKTGDSEQTISDETVKGQQLLQQKGKSATLIDLMTSVDASVKSKSEHIHYNEALAALITIMENQK